MSRARSHSEIPLNINGKKRKRRSTEDASGSDAQNGGVKQRRKTASEDDEENEDEPSVDTPRAQRKKSRKSEQSSSFSGEGLQISEADFLSAVLAAATATSEGPQSNLTDISSESVLHALQNVDVSKIAQVFRGVPDSQQTALSQLLVPDPTSLDQVPVSTRKTTRAVSGSASGPAYGDGNVVNRSSEEYEELLATKWINAAQLKELGKTSGLTYKKGKFTNAEEQQLDSAIERYVHARQLNPDQLNEIIFPKEGKPKEGAFWSELARAVPRRPVISVYHHVRRMRHPLKSQGRWLPAEDLKLKEAVASHGQHWEKVSFMVGRKAADCRDRWRNHIVRRDVRVTGPWSAEEEEELTRIVEEMTVKQGGSLDDDVFWGAVSDCMDNRRNRQQCRVKWTDSLSKRVKSNGNYPRWSSQDAFILVHKVDSLHVRDDSEIDWKSLVDEDWNLWSAHTLQRRWITMKRSVKGHEEMSMQEIMEILKAKKTNFEPAPVKTKKPKKYTSAETVDSGED